MLNRETWYKEVSSSDLLLNELSKRKSGILVKNLFRKFRFIKPMYFTNGVVFNEPQMLAANLNRTGRYWILGHLSDYSTILIDCQTGRIGCGDEWVEADEDCHFHQIPECSLYFDERIFSSLEAKACSPENSFDLTISGTLEMLGIDDEPVLNSLGKYQKWLRDKNIPETAWSILSAMRPNVEVPLGWMGALFTPDAMVRFNDTSDGFFEQGFFAVGNCGVDANVIVLDCRKHDPVVGVMALEEAYDFVFERHFIPISPSFSRYFHDVNCLYNMPLDIWDARDLKSDLSWF